MNIGGLDLNLLMLFEAVYSTRSISRAATILDMNQPTVSNALGRLRKQLDDPLFVRDGRGVAPTPRAEAIIGPVRRALVDIRSITQAPDAPFDPTTSEREFRLYLLDVFEPLLLPPLVRVAANSAGMSIKMVPPQAMPCEEAVLDGSVDLGISLRPDRRPGLLWERLCPMDLVVIARRGHPQVDGTITEEQIDTLGHVLLDLDIPEVARGAAANIRKFAMRERMQLRTVLRVPRPSAIAMTVSITDLIAFSPRLYAQSLADLWGLQVIDPPKVLSDMDFFMIWSERKSDDPGVTWLRETIRAEIEHHQHRADPVQTG
jgi:DNA-binding transcriptional LysR family regulator